MDPRFVAAIRNVDPDVTCDELADIVWLATHNHPETVAAAAGRRADCDIEVPET